MGYMQPLKSFLEGEMKSITVNKIYLSNYSGFYFWFFYENKFVL